MEKFKKFYMWSYDIKNIVGLWFAVIIMLNAFFLAILGENAMNLWVVLETLGVATAIGISQHIIMPKSYEMKKVASKRSLLWVAISLCAVVAGSYLFGWYGEFWCYIALWVLMAMGDVAMLFAIYLERN